MCLGVVGFLQEILAMFLLLGVLLEGQEEEVGDESCQILQDIIW